VADTPNIDYVKDWLDQLPEEQIERQLQELSQEQSILSAKIGALREALELKKRFREWYGPAISIADADHVTGIEAALVTKQAPTIREAVLAVMADPAHEEWPVPDLYGAIVANGWLEDSTQALRSLGAALSRMTAEGEIRRVRRGVYTRTPDLAATQGLLDIGDESD
jgi:hypothetical protein